MTTQIKYLAFKGIEKKEQILFKSFLNLAKNELEFQVVILKQGHDDEPDILIRDEAYEFPDGEQHLQQLPSMLIGKSVDSHEGAYIQRPVQWSDFKQTLAQLDISVVKEEDTAERVLPSNVDLAIIEGPADRTVGAQTEDASSYLDMKDYEYQLDNMSVDYNSFTNSDYVHVAEDVEQFNKKSAESKLNEAVVLITDDESTSVNSVLIIETSEYETWEYSQSEATVMTGANRNVYVVDHGDEGDDEDTVVLEQKVGLQLQPNEEYWLADSEIIVNHETLFCIKPERSMLYSATEPGYWADILRDGVLSRLPLSRNWQPNDNLKAYPISCLHWVNALIYEIDELVADLKPDASYILQQWPQFDLIEMDNSLLKLCTMLFVRPESVNSLMTKSGYSKSTVVGLINACYRIGLIKSADKFEQENSVSLLASDGVIGKFIDVFR